jgi:tetratricopeptide (TPR) repeat protein
MTYADAERYPQAIEFLEQCLRVSRPEESHLRKAYALLVSALSQADQEEAAWNRCQEGLALYPDDKELLFRSALLHHHFGRLRQAETAYRRVLKETPERHFQSIDQGLAGPKARHNLAIVYDDMGRLDQAEAEWRTILNATPDYLPACRALGDLLLRQNDWPGVTREIERMERGPGRLPREARLLRGRLLAEQGKIPAALVELNAADTLDPQDLEPLRVQCRVLFEQGPSPDAEQALEQLVQRAPDDASAWHNLGTVRSQRHDLPGAVTAYRRSLELRPEGDSTRRQLEQSLRDLGDSAAPHDEWSSDPRRTPAEHDLLAPL